MFFKKNPYLIGIDLQKHWPFTSRKQKKSKNQKETIRRRCFSFNYKTLPKLNSRDPKAFKRYMRFSVKHYEDLLQNLKPLLQKQPTRFRLSLSPELKLQVPIRYLATGLSYVGLALEFCVIHNTIRKVIKEICNAIVTKFNEQYLHCTSTPAEWEKISDKFWCKWNMPNCCGVEKASIFL